MTDILNLLDTTIPLLKRYDAFLEWENQYAFTVINLAAEKLGIGIAHVEVYYELGKLDDEEFALIDKKEINIDSMVLIIKEDKKVRLNVYSNYDKINNSFQPIKSLKEFIDDEISPPFDEILNKVSPKAYGNIAKYLKQAGIENGTINKRFRSFLVQCSRTLIANKKLSDAQIGWIARAISHDRSHSLNVFTNDILKKDFPDDLKLFKEIIELTKTYKVK